MERMICLFIVRARAVAETPLCSPRWFPLKGVKLHGDSPTEEERQFLSATWLLSHWSMPILQQQGPCGLERQTYRRLPGCITGLDCHHSPLLYLLLTMSLIGWLLVFKLVAQNEQLCWGGFGGCTNCASDRNELHRPSTAAVALWGQPFADAQKPTLHSLPGHWQVSSGPRNIAFFSVTTTKQWETIIS